jgi:hypothetical protein
MRGQTIASFVAFLISGDSFAESCEPGLLAAIGYAEEQQIVESAKQRGTRERYKVLLGPVRPRGFAEWFPTSSHLESESVKL